MTDASVSLSNDDIVGYIDTLSNWGRWGASDSKGTLNFVTERRTAEAARLISSGRSVGLARPLGIRPTGSKRGPHYFHVMTGTGELAPAEGAGVARDWFSVGCHGFECTHLDSHSHIFWNGKMYNGRDAGTCSLESGAVAGGIEPWWHGVSGRGILVDGPEIRKKSCLDPGEGLYPEELDQWYDEKGIRPQSGDVLFVRTGRDRWHERTGGNAETVYESPGLHGSCLPWLSRREIAVLAGDGTNDALPSGCSVLDAFGPIHVVGLVAMGLWLIDNAELGELHAACHENERYEFFVTIAPLRLRRATGCPVNPIAIF